MNGYLRLGVTASALGVAAVTFFILDRVKGIQEVVPGVAGAHVHHDAWTEIRHVKVGSVNTVQVINHDAYDETPVTHCYGQDWERGITPPGTRYDVVITIGHWTKWHYTSSMTPSRPVEQ